MLALSRREVPLISRVVGMFGAAIPPSGHTRRVRWIDLAILVAVGGTLFGLVRLAQEWTGALRPTVEIDLSPWALPALHVLLAGARAGRLRPLAGLHAGLRLLGRQGPRAPRRVLVPLLDILQSIPVLGFMPGLVLGLVALFPRSNVGLELAAVIMIFTGQAWNMTFSFYHSLKSVPADLREAADGLPLQLVAALQVGRAALRDDRAGLEQHDEHGGRLVLPDDQRGLRARRPATSACPGSAPT